MDAVILETVEHAIKFQPLCRSSLNYVTVLFIHSMLSLFKRKNRIPVNECFDCSCPPTATIKELFRETHVVIVDY